MNIKTFLLTRIRLTHYLLIFAVLFFILSTLLPKIELQGAALTLFSVNSFLYGFYISPIISGQRNRIDQLHRLVAVEVNKLDEIIQYARRMEPEFQEQIMTVLAKYKLKAAKGGARVGEAEFAAVNDVVVGYSGEKKDPHKEMMKSVFSAQQNRAEIRLLVESKVYSNEWIVMAILFTITIAFILFTRLPEIPLLGIIPAVLCAGLSMLIVILIKMSTLTHKRARSIWTPLKEFIG